MKPPPSLLRRSTGQPELTQVHPHSSKLVARVQHDVLKMFPRGGGYTQQLRDRRSETAAKRLVTRRFLKDVTPESPRRHYFNLTAVNGYVGRF